MIASILGVGTELTSGQIINKNAVWISKKLKDMGVTTACHLVVPDDRPLILDALAFCAAKSDLVFVTGGLGPTTDDFTRDLIAQWSGQALKFDQASWDHVNERLKSRSIQIRESQRQQCLFPEGAQVLHNPEGTANAFQMKVQNKDVFVLPGPPKEIEAIWNSSIALTLKEKTKGLDKYITYSWDTMGLGESDVSHITESCLDGVEVEKGYRVHLPYVEVKMSFFESQKNTMMPLVKKVDEALAHITVTRDGDDVPALIARQLKNIDKIEVVDALSGQVLLNRLNPALREFMTQKNWSYKNQEIRASLDPLTLRLILKPWDSVSAVAEIHYKGASFKNIFEAPFFIQRMKDRKALYFAERALIFWNQKLKDLI